MAKRIDRQTKEEIICKYKQRPITIQQIADLFGLSNPTVIKILHEYNVTEWTKAQLYSPDFKPDYFHEINEANKAYFLGLLTTDGCIFWKNNRQAFVSLELKEDDLYIIEKMLSEIGCNKKPVYSKRSGSYAVQIHSKQMVEDLQRYELTPRSSMTQRLPRNIPKEFIGDYVRGLFDGDGSFGFYSRPNRKVHRKAARISSGSRLFIDDLTGIMLESINVSEPKVYYSASDHSYTATWVRNDDLEAIINFLYYDHCICLERKRIICDEIVREIRQYRDNRFLTAS